MSQAGYDPNSKEMFGSSSKIRFEPYSQEELASDEFFWNQLSLIAKIKNMEYFYYFMSERGKYLDEMADM